MKKLIPLVVFVLCIQHSFAQDADERIIRNMMDEQIQAWNNGNIEGFMKAYWNNDSLMFIGNSGITYGYAKTLANYKRGYPTKSKMGTLSFDIISMERLSADLFFVVGKWRIVRDPENLQGHFTLLLRRLGDEWKIVKDHSS